MVVLDVFCKNIQITYKTTLFSKATFFVLVFGVVSVVLPFIFAYKSCGFWIKRDIFYEQPDIKFKGNYIFLATTNNSSLPVTCSTYPYFQQMLEMQDYCSIIKFREIDRNFDGKNDEFQLLLQVRLPEKVHLTSATIVIAIEYKLDGFCALQMQSAIIYQDILPPSVSYYLLVGDVILTQSGPLICHKKQINNLYNYSIISNERNIDDYQISNIISGYSQRNVSTRLTNVYTSFIPSDSSQQFDFNIKLRFPENRIYYKPGFWQIMKWAWIQYFAIYIIISWLIRTLKNYIFNRRLVLFYEDNPIKKNQ